jgi:hypothetical protein
MIDGLNQRDEQWKQYMTKLQRDSEDKDEQWKQYMAKLQLESENKMKKQVDELKVKIDALNKEIKKNDMEGSMLYFYISFSMLRRLRQHGKFIVAILDLLKSPWLSWLLGERKVKLA